MVGTEKQYFILKFFPHLIIHDVYTQVHVCMHALKEY